MKLDYYYDPKNDLIFENEEHFKTYKKTKISFSSSEFKPEDFGLSIIEIESPDEPNTDILKKEIFDDIYEKDGKYYLKVSIVDITEEEKNNLEKEKKFYIQGEIDYWEKEIDLMTPKLQNPIDKNDLRTEEEINDGVLDTTHTQKERNYVNALKELLEDENILLKAMPRQREYM
jgi:glutathionyl-hydroquinone reductase